MNGNLWLIKVHTFSDSEHLKAHSFVHWAVWLGVVGSCVTLSFILAEAIPFFGALTSKHVQISEYHLELTVD
jgi:hypothetical protein